MRDTEICKRISLFLLYFLGRCSTDDDCLNSNTHCSRLYASCEFGTCQCDQFFYPVSESQCRRGIET